LRAMILAAGMGTRLQPLTFVRPKVMIPVRGTPVLEFWMERLRLCGFGSAILNAYHLKEKLVETVSGKDWPVRLDVRTEPQLLGTGGGIRTALDSFGSEPFTVINGDIVCDAPLDELYARHVKSGTEVSLLLHDYPEFNNVAVDRDGSVLGFGEEAERLCSGQNGVRKLAFTGIHFINPSALLEFSPGVPRDILDIYRVLIARGKPPAAMFSPGLFWREMGSVESYSSLTAELGSVEVDSLPPLHTGRSVWLHPEATVAEETVLKGTVIAGRGVRVGRDVRLENVILWDNVEVEDGSRLQNCIVADGIRVSGNHAGKIFVPESQ
jgi:mannose-1-phosphate guanylyltransferase